MKKTSKKYTYKDFLLRKSILKQEIKDIEDMASVPKTLGYIGNNIKSKAIGLVKNPSFFDTAIDTGIGIGLENIISKMVNKKSVFGKALIIASTYLIPLAIDKSKKIIAKKSNKID